ncbi:hypothetical protein [Serratia aquatilis]|uniref:DUF202 domain-containing protein n=1 Tax=Serratia aquatilis TaxID=1737515 RepID=A0ABV6EDK3_9GAMM
MKVTNALDDYIHLRANYWILTGVSGISLGLFMISFFNQWGLVCLISLGGVFTLSAFYTIKLYLKKRSVELKLRNMRQ